MFAFTNTHLCLILSSWQSMCIEVHNNKLRRVYVCIYKHPSVSDTVFLTHLSQMADRLLIICPDIVFLGDMNCCPKKSDAIKEFCESFWSTVSPFMTDKRHRNGNTFMLQENDKIVVDDKLVANIFNDHFCNIASRIGFDDPITTTHDVINKHRDHPSVLKIRETYSKEADSFSFSCVDANVVTSKLRSIKINKGHGYDCIPGKLIRLAHEVLSPHFTYMLNQCITRSVFPSNMKNAELSPLYKKKIS